MQTFKTADLAIEQLMADGFYRVENDPDYPFLIAWNDGDGMKARIMYDHNREYYYISGVHL